MDIYKCDICGNVVSFVDNKGVPVQCCGQPMTKQEPNAKENEGNEKHVPVVEGLKIKVGSVQHPMEQDHYIELIQAIVDDRLIIEKRLHPGDVPELELLPEYEGKNITARCYCNKHGLWTS